MHIFAVKDTKKKWLQETFRSKETFCQFHSDLGLNQLKFLFASCSCLYLFFMIYCVLNIIHLIIVKSAHALLFVTGLLIISFYSQFRKRFLHFILKLLRLRSSQLLSIICSVYAFCSTKYVLF